MTKRTLITALVLAPIMLDGERIMPDLEKAVAVELPPKDFAELEAIGAVAKVEEVEDETGNNGTDAGATEGPAPKRRSAKAPEPEPEPATDNASE